MQHENGVLGKKRLAATDHAAMSANYEALPLRGEICEPLSDVALMRYIMAFSVIMNYDKNMYHLQADIYSLDVRQ